METNSLDMRRETRAELAFGVSPENANSSGRTFKYLQWAGRRMAGGEDVKARMAQMMQERERQARLERLREDTTRKIDFLSKKAVIEHHEVYLLVKEFFKEFLERRYEFTINELRTELKHVYISHATRQHIAHVLEQIEAIEYTSIHYNRQDLVKTLELFKDVVNQLVHVHVHNKSFFDHMRAIFGGKQDMHTIIAELPTLTGDDAYHRRIYTLIEKCYVALDHHNLNRAKAAYQALLGEYELLDEPKRVQYYEVLHQTYLDLSNRAKTQK
jgi:hypothetical protein